ncbi:DUF4365 domain-containing protein [Streptomyces sp. NPDC090088]|uniref:DUF4365 domain-containing protein n=1 Tax=Streptomyces sp. NPDC090088 TaxID=3365944 RepID=UPI0038166DBE
MTRIHPTHLVDRAGVARACYLVTTRLGWLFREQQTSDVGIDAHLEVVTGASLAAGRTGRATGSLLAVQIKSGRSCVRAAAPGGWWVACDSAHVEYWLRHWLPVILMLFDPTTECVHWQHANADTLVPTGKHCKIFVPAHQQIDEASAGVLVWPLLARTTADLRQTLADRLPGIRTAPLHSHVVGIEYFPHPARTGDMVRATRKSSRPLPHWLAGLRHSTPEAAASLRPHSRRPNPGKLPEQPVTAHDPVGPSCAADDTTAPVPRHQAEAGGPGLPACDHHPRAEHGPAPKSPEPVYRVLRRYRAELLLIVLYIGRRRRDDFATVYRRIMHVTGTTVERATIAQLQEAIAYARGWMASWDVSG